MTTGNHGLCAVGGGPILSTSQFKEQNLTSPPLPLHRCRVRQALRLWQRAGARARRLTSLKNLRALQATKRSQTTGAPGACASCVRSSLSVFRRRVLPPPPNRFRRIFVHSFERGTPLRAGAPPLCSGVAEPAAAGACCGLLCCGVFLPSDGTRAQDAATWVHH